jgi:hypothetical protein
VGLHLSLLGFDLGPQILQFLVLVCDHFLVLLDGSLSEL